MALSANAIVSLADVKAYMRITSSSTDSLLETLIDAASTRIESYCDRNFIEQEYREFYNTNGQRRLRLRHFPVSQVTRLSTGSKQAFTVGGSISSDLRATVEVQDNKVVLDRYTSNGTNTTSNIAFGSYKTASAIVDEINTKTGFTATLVANCLAEDLFRVGGVNCNTAPQSFYFPDQDDTGYRLHEDRATIEFVDQSDYAFFGTGTDQGPRFPITFAGVEVEYKAGYENIAAIPNDLKEAAKMLVQYMFESSAKDPSLTSESIGSYTYSRGTDPLMTEGGISMLLSPYVDRKS